MKRLTILICTHNRVDLLAQTLASLNAAARPDDWSLNLLVAANGCTDGTHEFLDRYRQQQNSNGSIALTWFEEPVPGKSHALNSAISRLNADVVAFVDDDHRVDSTYLANICKASDSYPDITMFCGRILPDWDGREPQWVHDEGPYSIYPLPVPRYDQGPCSKPILAAIGPLPGGGNLILRCRIFASVGRFSTELGPHGHDLGGGEDGEFVLRALEKGNRLQYVPEILQYHYVDSDRLKMSYLVRKAYQRSRASARVRNATLNKMPLYMWRKIVRYAWNGLFSLSWAKRRFYLMRCTAALGEMKGIREAINRHEPSRPRIRTANALILLPVASVVAITVVSYGGTSRPLLWPALLVSLAGALALTGKSLLDFSQTGPKIRDEILAHYKGYTAWAVSRLALWSWLVLFLLSGAGITLYVALCIWLHHPYSTWEAAAAATAAVCTSTILQFIRNLIYNPGLLIASMNYRASRFYPLWGALNPTRLRVLEALVASAITLPLVGASWKLIQTGRLADLAALWSSVLFFTALMIWSGRHPEARPKRSSQTERQPNILMIGSDTLRADRIRPDLTPNIYKLVRRGIHFTHCYVPCARTAPSLISLLTGTWPHAHGARDNFIAPDAVRFQAGALPQWLKKLGYQTAAISDWCGADMGKFDFGFDYLDLPEDQWNLKYFIRQGPKDLRLFLSLFLHNRLGKFLLPEIYYLGGVPLTTQLGKQARHLLSRLSADGQPFLLNLFYSTTHPPFASEYPWYVKFAEPNYAGPSKFVMARLSDPFDIIRRQGEPRQEFDLDQILNLYDGSVAQFDHEIGLMLAHLEKSGLIENTIVVVYSDHGMEFFEHDTWGQGNSALGDVSPRIPLVISDPRRSGSFTISDVTRSIDIAPTLLDLVGGAPPSGIDGVSLKPLFDNPSDSLNLPAFNETGVWITNIPGMPEKHLRYPGLLDIMEVPDLASGALAIKPEFQAIIVAAKDRMIRCGKWKLLYQPLADGFLLKLFDVSTDPGCNHDVSVQHPDIMSELWTKMRLFLLADNLPHTLPHDPASLAPQACP